MLKNSQHLLLLGSTGFIGENFIKLILKKNYYITCISLKKENQKNKKITHISCDISNFNLLKKKIKNKNFDYLINLSGYVDHSNFSDNGKKIIDVHLMGLINVLTVINISKLKLILQIGSSEEYGFRPSPQKEDVIGTPFTPYSFSKISSTNFLKMLMHNQKIPFAIARIFLVYGPGQKNNRIVPYVINNCLKNQTFKITDGNQLRDFLYIDDLVEGLYKIMNSKKSVGKIINLASGKPISIKKLVKKIHNLVGLGKPIFGSIKKRKSENKSLYADISKINKIMIWKPKTNLDKGLVKTIKYFSKND